MSSTRRPPPPRSRPQRAAAPRGEGSRDEDARPRRRSRSSDLLARVAVGVPAAFLAVFFDDLGGLAWALLMIGLGAVCLHELYRLLHRWRPVAAVGFAALTAMVLVALYDHSYDVLLAGMVAVPVTFLGVLLRGHRGMTVSVAGTLLGIYWVAFAFAHAVLLRQLPHGGGVMIDVMVGTFLADTGAYVGGRLFGHRPLAPEVSPHKTVEGLVCGMLVAIVAVFVAGLFQSTWLTQSDALALGAAIAVLGPLGDLFESVVKRDAGTKDAGGLFGAHGGALDRLDAVIFTVVAAYYIWLALM
jgi:phosphatidate cytidylyltransferase